MSSLLLYGLTDILLYHDGHFFQILCSTRRLKFMNWRTRSCLLLQDFFLLLLSLLLSLLLLSSLSSPSPSSFLYGIYILRALSRTKLFYYAELSGVVIISPWLQRPGIFHHSQLSSNIIWSYSSPSYFLLDSLHHDKHITLFHADKDTILYHLYIKLFANTIEVQQPYQSSCFIILVYQLQFSIQIIKAPRDDRQIVKCNYPQGLFEGWWPITNINIHTQGLFEGASGAKSKIYGIYET